MSVVSIHFSKRVVVQKTLLLLIVCRHFNFEWRTQSLLFSIRALVFAFFVKDAGKEVLLLARILFLPVFDHNLTFSVEKNLICIRFHHHFEQGLRLSHIEEFILVLVDLKLHHCLQWCYSLKTLLSFISGWISTGAGLEVEPDSVCEENAQLWALYDQTLHLFGLFLVDVIPQIMSNQLWNVEFEVTSQLYIVLLWPRRVISHGQNAIQLRVHPDAMQVLVCWRWFFQ